MNRRLWVPLLAVLLVAVIVGPGTVTAAEPRVTTRTVTIPAAAFQPTYDHETGFIRYANNGYKLETVDPALPWFSLDNAKQFYAPLFFEAPSATVRRITLYAYDNNPNTGFLPTGGPAGDICLSLLRTTPMADTQQVMGSVCSWGAGTLVREFPQGNLAIRRITGAYGAYLMLHLPDFGNTGLSFKGARITYSY